MIYSAEYQGRQAPDLFAYSKDKSDWFFCEVKGGKDSFSTEQRKAFTSLERVAQKQIQVMYFKTMKSKFVL
jgi:hypothetical protein